MSRKESKFYIINSYDLPDNFFKNKISTPRGMKMNKWIQTTLLLMLRYVDFS